MTGSRERRRSERRKRKRRSAQRTASPEAVAESEVAAGLGAGGGAAAAESFSERIGRRSEARNQAVRDGLEPLHEGERPGAVTVAAAVAAVVSTIFTVSAALALLTSIDVGGEQPNPVPLVLFSVVLWAMTLGLWRARYWAVLGFQMLLVLFMLSSALGLLTVGNALQALGTLALLAGSATLFYFMIRAMARIQMPQRPASGAGDGRGAD